MFLNQKIYSQNDSSSGSYISFVHTKKVSKIVNSPWADDDQIQTYYHQMVMDSFNNKVTILLANSDFTTPFMGTKGMIIDIMSYNQNYNGCQPFQKEFIFICDKYEGFDPNLIPRSLFFHDPKTNYWIRLKKQIIGDCFISQYVLNDNEHYVVIKKEYFIPLMLVAIFLVEPRSAHTIGNIPLAMAGGIFLANILLPALEKISEEQIPNNNRGIKVFLIISIPYLLVNSIYQGFTLSQNHLSKSEQTAMTWIKENTPEDSQFLVITGEPEAMCDSSAEWFPALTERESLSTLQGREWILGRRFGEFIGHKSGIQNCIDQGLDCLKLESDYFGADYDYIYISIQTPTNNCKSVEISARTTSGLIATLEAEGKQEYSIKYRSEKIVLFEKKDNEK